MKIDKQPKDTRRHARLVRLVTGNKVTIKGAVFIEGERKWSRVKSVEGRLIKLKSPIYGSSTWLDDELELYEPNEIAQTRAQLK